MTEIDKMRILIRDGFKYDRDSGLCYKPNGEVVTSFDGRYFRFSYKIEDKPTKTRVHRFAFYYEYGVLPRMIDHINQDKKDNRISNLRDGSGCINTRNTTRVIKARGYWYQSRVNKWVASIKINYKSKHLGYFDTECEAHEAYKKAKENLIYESK